jgi:hypothetical protein
MTSIMPWCMKTIFYSMDKFETHIFKTEKGFYLAIAPNMWSAPCKCPLDKRIHWHHNLGIKNEPIKFVVEENIDYPNE